MHHSASSKVTAFGRVKSTEIAVFLFLAFLIAPFVAVTGIGGYGLIIWLAQLFA